MIFASSGRIRLTIAEDVRFAQNDGTTRVSNREAFLNELIRHLDRLYFEPEAVYSDVLRDGCPAAEAYLTDADGHTARELNKMGKPQHTSITVMLAGTYVETLRKRIADCYRDERRSHPLSKEIELVQSCAATHVLVDYQLRYDAAPRVIIARLIQPGRTTGR